VYGRSSPHGVPPGHNARRRVFLTEGGATPTSTEPRGGVRASGGTLRRAPQATTSTRSRQKLACRHRREVLVDGKEVETLSGQHDTRRPLAKNSRLGTIDPLSALAIRSQRFNLLRERDAES